MKTPALRVIAALTVALLLATAVACTGDQLTQSLDLTVAAAEIAVPIIATCTGVPPALAAQLNQYVAAVGEATDKSIGILDNKSLSDAQRAAAIEATFADAIAQSSLIAKLLPNAPATVAAAIRAVIDAVTKFISQVAGLHASLSLPAYGNAFTSSGPTHLKVSHGRLQKMRQRARAVAAAAKARAN